MKTSRVSRYQPVGTFVEAPKGLRVNAQRTGVSAFWTEIALRMATNPGTWMLVYTYPHFPSHGRAKDGRSLALGTRKRINQHEIQALEELRTDSMRFEAEVYTEDNETFSVYARYVQIND